MTTQNTMPRWNFIMLAALVVSSTRVLAGCSSGDSGTHQADPTKNGYSETSTLHLAAGASQTEVGTVETSMSSDNLSIALYADWALDSPTLVMDLPVAPGDQQLEALHAVLLFPGKEPIAIEGVLEVREIAPPCGTGACGRLTAVLELTPSTASSAARLSGSAPLSYSEEATEISNSSDGSGGGGGCGQSNNGWGLGSYGSGS